MRSAGPARAAESSRRRSTFTVISATRRSSAGRGTRGPSSRSRLARAAVEIGALALVVRSVLRAGSPDGSPARRVAGAATGAGLAVGPVAAGAAAVARSPAGVEWPSGWSRSHGVAGPPTCSRARRSRRCMAAAAGAAAVAVTRRYPRRWWLPASAGSVLFGAAAGERWRRSCSTRCSTTSRRCPRARLDPTCSSWRARPASRWGRCTRSTPAAGRPRPTPTWPGWGRPSGSSCSTRCSTATAATRSGSWSRTSSRTSATATCPRGVLFAALVAPAAALAVQRLSWELSPERGTPGALPALALAAAAVGAPTGLIGNRLSRAIERRSDAYSLALTGAPEAFISFERAIAVQNVADLEPPRWLTSLLATHPPTAERIGAAVASRSAAATGQRYSSTAGGLVGSSVPDGAAVLGQVLDALAGLPLRVVVLHRVDQLPHELGAQVDPRDDDAGDLVVLDLVVDARERDRELVVGVADVREIRVYAGHDVRREVDVDVPLGASGIVHRNVVSHREDPRRRRREGCARRSPTMSSTIRSCSRVTRGSS